MVDISYLSNDNIIGDKICLLCYGGSNAYGTALPDSDIDIRGVCLNSVDKILGLGDTFEQYERKEPDTVIYSMNKFFQLLMKSNPNVLELLGVREYLVLDEIGQKIYNNRHLFLSKQVYVTFRGYAKAQLQKIELDMYNNKRVSKHAMHLIRLYYMCLDILKYGEIVTYRPERDLLKSIRLGRYQTSTGEFTKEFWDLKRSLEVELEGAYNVSKLPDEINKGLVNKLLMEINLHTLKVNNIV